MLHCLLAWHYGLIVNTSHHFSEGMTDCFPYIHISIFFKVSLKRGVDLSNSGGFFWTSVINFSTMLSEILNARDLKIRMDSDWLSVFYHSTAGKKSF